MGAVNQNAKTRTFRAAHRAIKKGFETSLEFLSDEMQTELVDEIRSRFYQLVPPPFNKEPIPDDAFWISVRYITITVMTRWFQPDFAKKVVADAIEVAIKILDNGYNSSQT